MLESTWETSFSLYKNFIYTLFKYIVSQYESPVKKYV